MKKLIEILLILLPAAYSIVRFNLDKQFYSIIIIVSVLVILIRLVVKFRTQIWILFGICYIFLDLTFHQTNFKEIFQLLLKTNLPDIIIATVFLIGTFVLRAYKWKYLLGHTKKIGFEQLFASLMIGFAGNVVFPARIGELLRAYVLGKNENISKSLVFATIVLERIFDGMVLILMVILLLLLLPVSSSTLITLSYIGIIFYILVFVFIIMFYSKKYLFLSILKLIPFKKVTDKIRGLLEYFYNGLHILKNSKQLLKFIFLTILTWLCGIIMVYFYLHSINTGAIVLKDSNIGFFLFSMLVMAVINLAVSVPSTPGYVGPYQWATIVAFSIASPAVNVLNSPQYICARYASLLLWFCESIPIVLIGIFYFIKKELKLSVIKDIKKQK